MKKCLSYMLILLLSAKSLHAQNITGRWEGTMNGDQFLQVNVIQKGNELCGYTFDHLLADPSSYCRAKFYGRYDARKKRWILQGETMLENHYNHILMKLTFWMESDNRDDLMRGKLGHEGEGLLGKIAERLDEGFLLVKSADTYTPFGIQMQPCFTPTASFERKPKNYSTVVIGDSSVIPAMIDNTHIADTVVKTKLSIKAVAVQQKDSSLADKVNNRRQKEESHLIVNSDNLNLKLYDNGIVDDDTVSVFYNGKLLVSHQRLSEKPVELNIKLDTSQLLHTITLYAENLGSIPPNTALVVVIAGDKRYELFAKADLSENAVLVFEYRKKE